MQTVSRLLTEQVNISMQLTYMHNLKQSKDGDEINRQKVSKFPTVCNFLIKFISLNTFYGLISFLLELVK